MKSRNENDLRKLNDPNLDVDGVNTWIRGLFLGLGTEKFRIPEEILEFGIKVMTDNYIKAEEDNVRHMIRRKILHTKEVVEAGYAIVEAERDENFNPYMVGSVTFLHDMGRFSQAHLGAYSDAKTGFNHAEEGSKMILRADFPESVEMGIDLRRLCEAITCHSKISYLGNDLYAKLIRDADKLALLDYFHYHIEEFRISEGKVTPGALEAFLSGRLVEHKYFINKIDIFLAWLSWIYDMNFEATKKLFEAGGMKEYMLREIERMDREVYGIVLNRFEEII